jgi:hypothetical protein
MKIRIVLVVSACSVAAFAMGGCAAPGTANTKKNRDDVALMKEEAQRYEKRTAA